MSVKNVVFLLLIMSILVIGCQCGEGKDIPDVSNIEIGLKIRRFERDLFALDTSQMKQGMAVLENKYPEFSKLFFGPILGSTDPRIAHRGREEYVKGFISHPAVRKLYDTCMIAFQNTDAIEAEFEQAFRFFKFYFPEQPIPTVTTFISEYSLAAFVYGENDLAVGLDFFLGENYPYQDYNPQNTNFSNYLTRTFNKDHLVLKTLKPLVQDLLGSPSGNRLLDHMIHNGKELFILDRLLPNAPDSVKLEFTPKQVQWCKDNELEIWVHFLKEDLLYSTDWSKFRKLVEYSPNSPGMPPEAPGRTANWLGWQIVKSFMKRHPDTSLEELIALKDAQELLNQSKYKPAR